MDDTRRPVRITLQDELERSRLTVFFRLLLAIPHFVWLSLWGAVAVMAAVLSWFITLALGRTPSWLHGFLARYVRYTLHVYAYLALAANPYPGFVGEEGTYPLDVEIDGPVAQRRWVTALRLVLAIPAILLATVFSGQIQGGSRTAVGGAIGVIWAVAFLAWFAALARGRITPGFRDLLVWALGYSAQTWAYVFMLTDRYPTSDPRVVPLTDRAPHPVDVVGASPDERRSRLTVFFRLLLAFPHFVWLLLWGIVVAIAVIVAWIATLATGRCPDALHRFFASYVRYAAHVSAFAYLVANPFPGFVGRAGSYPFEVDIAPRAAQSRWLTLFRAPLALPALIVSAALGSVLSVVAVLGWFASLATGRMPSGLGQAGAYAIRYSAQLNAYGLLLTDRYPDSGPAAARDAPADLVPAPA
jgi:hypothetical protein